MQSAILEPVQEITLKDIYDIKVATQNKLLELATDGDRTRDPEWLIRHFAPGDEGSATDFVDLDNRNNRVSNAGSAGWALDQASLTAAHDLSAIFTANEAVAENKYIGICGFFDRAPMGDFNGTIDSIGGFPTRLGHIIGIAFYRGTTLLAYWGVADLYAYDEVVGYCRSPVVYESTETISVKFLSCEISHDKGTGLLAFTCEKYGLNIAPAGRVAGGM